MLISVLAILASSPTCTDVPHQCRACKIDGTVKRCSNIGIACQPVVRVCKPIKDSVMQSSKDGSRKEQS